MPKKSKVTNNKDNKEITPKGSTGRDAKMAHTSDDGNIDLDNIPPELIGKLLSEVCVSRQEIFQGPLPPPEVVKEYEDILPGSFDRILKMTEENGKHRFEIDKHGMEMERVLIQEDIKLKYSGQKMAFRISISGIIAVVICAYLDQTTVASVLAGTTLISLVPNFIAGMRKEKEKEKKDVKKLGEQST